MDAGIPPSHRRLAGVGFGDDGGCTSVADETRQPMSRRDLFSMIGTVAGSAVMYQAMNATAYAAESGFTGMPNLTGAPKGATVLILGAGWAGMVSAWELQKAGYDCTQGPATADQPESTTLCMRATTAHACQMGWEVFSSAHSGHMMEVDASFTRNCSNTADSWPVKLARS